MENVQGFAFGFDVLKNAARGAAAEDTVEQLLARLTVAMGNVPMHELRYAFMRAHVGLQTLAGSALNRLKAAQGMKAEAEAKEADKALDAYRRLATVALRGHDRAAGITRWYQSAETARQASLRVLERRGLLDYQGDVLNKKVAAPIVGAVDKMAERVERMAKAVEAAEARAASAEAKAKAEAEAKAKAEAEAKAKARAEAEAA